MTSLLNYTSITIPPSVTQALQTIDSWSFDTFALADASNGRPLQYLVFYLFDRYGLMKKFKISSSVLDNFVNKIETGYLQSNCAFHNNVRAADVLQTMHYMISQTGLQKWLDDLDILACLLAALISDYEHEGLTNYFLVTTGSERALRYNDQSVNENHHVSAAFFVLGITDCNILSKLTRDEYRYLRNLVIEMVLATDMSFHFQYLSNLRSLLSSPNPTVEKKVVLAFVMHTCDMSNAAKSWNAFTRWTDLRLDEFIKQGDQERELGLPISPLCDRYKMKLPESQIHFLDFIVEPTFSICVEMLSCVLETVAEQRTSIQRNSIQRNSITGTKKFQIQKPWIACIVENRTKWKERKLIIKSRKSSTLSGKIKMA